jgi:hypothetical protein
MDDSSENHHGTTRIHSYLYISRLFPRLPSYSDSEQRQGKPAPLAANSISAKLRIDSSENLRRILDTA